MPPGNKKLVFFVLQASWLLYSSLTERVAETKGLSRKSHSNAKILFFHTFFCTFLIESCFCIVNVTKSGFALVRGELINYLSIVRCKQRKR